MPLFEVSLDLHRKETFYDSRIRTFEDLVVWQKAIAFVKRVYLITAEGDLKRDFGLRDQLRRAAVSVPTKIAEGFERSSRKEYLLFLNIAKGSAGEVRSLCRVSLISAILANRLIMSFMKVHS